MIDLGQTVFQYDAHREMVFTVVFALIALTPPLLRWMRTRQTNPEGRTARRQFLGRLFLLALLLPPLAWAMSDGRIGATVHQRHERLVGESLFHRYLGAVDLEGVSLHITAKESYGRPVVFLEGAKRGERLRIDGFQSPDGKTLQEILQKHRVFPVPE